MILENWRTPKKIMACLCIFVAPFAMSVHAEESDDKAPVPYLLNTCIVSGEINECPISGETLGTLSDPLIKVYENREVRFCCAACIRKFEADPAGYFEKIDAALIAQQRPFYPLDNCVVRNEKLDSMGEAVDYLHRGRLIRFCCKGCIKSFKKDPEAYLAKLDAAIVKQQEATYPTKTCIVSGKELGDDVVTHVVGNRLFRLCCKGCIKKIDLEPGAYIQKLDALIAKQS